MYTQSMCDDFFVFFGYYYLCTFPVYLRNIWIFVKFNTDRFLLCRSVSFYQAIPFYLL